MIEVGPRPATRGMTLFACRRKIRRGVIGIGRAEVFIDVTRSAVARRALIDTLAMARVARRGLMCADQRIRAVIHSRIFKARGYVATFATRRPVERYVIGIGRALQVTLMAVFATYRSALEVADLRTGVTAHARDTGVRCHERKARARVFCDLPDGQPAHLVVASSARRS